MPRRPHYPDLIRAFILSCSYPLTIAEIAAHLGIKKTTAYYHISCMLDTGELENKRNSPRSLRVTERGGVMPAARCDNLGR